MIGSTHYLSKDGEVFNIDLGTEEIKRVIAERFGGDGLALAKCYYEHLASLPEYGKFDIIGHFDIITKNIEAYALAITRTPLKVFSNWVKSKIEQHSGGNK